MRDNPNSVVKEYLITALIIEYKPLKTRKPDSLNCVRGYREYFENETRQLERVQWLPGIRFLNLVTFRQNGRGFTKYYGVNIGIN